MLAVQQLVIIHNKLTVITTIPYKKYSLGTNKFILIFTTLQNIYICHP